MFSEVSVCGGSVSVSGGCLHRGVCLHKGVRLHKGVCLHRGICLQVGVCLQGGLTTEGFCLQRGSAYTGKSIRSIINRDIFAFGRVK